MRDKRWSSCYKISLKMNASETKETFLKRGQLAVINLNTSNRVDRLKYLKIGATACAETNIAINENSQLIKYNIL